MYVTFWWPNGCMGQDGTFISHHTSLYDAPQQDMDPKGCSQTYQGYLGYFPIKIKGETK